MITEDIQKNIFNRQDAPWLVLITTYISQYLCGRLPDKVRLPFAQLNLVLLQWWPEQKQVLRDIYWNEMAACWSAYDALSPDDEQQTNDVQQLLSGAYIQLFVMQRFEQQLAEPRPLLPNDLNDIDDTTFNKVLDYYFQQAPTQHTQKLIDWVNEFDDDFSADWINMKAKLLGPVP